MVTKARERRWEVAVAQANQGNRREEPECKPDKWKTNSNSNDRATEMQTVPHKAFIQHGRTQASNDARVWRLIQTQGYTLITHKSNSVDATIMSLHNNQRSLAALKQGHSWRALTFPLVIQHTHFCSLSRSFHFHLCCSFEQHEGRCDVSRSRAVVKLADTQNPSLIS